MSSNHNIAIWTGVYDILPIVHTKWNQATGPTPEKNSKICFCLKFIKGVFSEPSGKRLVAHKNVLLSLKTPNFLY